MGFADNLEAALKARGFEPLIDRTEIYAFEDWWRRIQALIVKADTVIFALSPDSIASDICHKEIAFAASLNKRLAPIVCRPVDVEKVPAELSRLNFISFEDQAHFERNADQLARTFIRCRSPSAKLASRGYSLTRSTASSSQSMSKATLATLCSRSVQHGFGRHCPRSTSRKGRPYVNRLGHPVWERAQPLHQYCGVILVYRGAKEMTNAYHLNRRIFLAPNIGRRRYWLERPRNA
jgi:hypothetical protein